MPRPKIQVLFWCEDEREASLVRYLVRTMLVHIRLIPVETPKAAARMLREGWKETPGNVEAGPRCALLVRTSAHDRCCEVIDALQDGCDWYQGGKECAYYATNLALPVAVWDKGRTLPLDHKATLVVTAPEHGLLLEMIKVISVRKTGPRKKQPAPAARAMNVTPEWSREIEVCA